MKNKLLVLGLCTVMALSNSNIIFAAEQESTVIYSTAISEDAATRAYTGWTLDPKGWWYDNGDGTYPVNCWKRISGRWYHFNKYGYRQTGWLKLGGKWYYLNSSGVMLTGNQKISGKWYYLNSSGAMQTGWRTQNGYRYYYKPGAGNRVTGWCKISNYWYYFKPDTGIMMSGWVKVSGKYYYMNSNGVMQASKWIGNYYVSGSGAMLTNTWTPDGYYVDKSGKYQVYGYKIEGNYLVLPDIKLLLPNSWIGNIKVKRYTSRKHGIIYKDIAKSPSGTQVPLVFIYVCRCTTKPDYNTTYSSLDSPVRVELRTRLLLMGQPLDTPLPYYNQTQKSKIRSMWKNIPTVEKSVIVR